MRVHWHMRDMMRAPLPKRAVASKAANLPYAELEASPVSPPNWAGLARALYIYLFSSAKEKSEAVNFDHQTEKQNGVDPYILFSF